MAGTNTTNVSVSNGSSLILDDTLGSPAHIVAPNNGGVAINGGALTMIGGSGSTDNQSIPRLTGGSGPTTITIIPGTQAVTTAKLSVGNDIRAGRQVGNSMLIRGTNLGGVSLKTTRVMLTGGVTLSQTGGSGTPTVGILPYALGDTSRHRHRGGPGHL